MCQEFGAVFKSTEEDSMKKTLLLKLDLSFSPLFVVTLKKRNNFFFKLPGEKLHGVRPSKVNFGDKKVVFVANQKLHVHTKNPQYFVDGLFLKCFSMWMKN